MWFLFQAVHFALRSASDNLLGLWLSDVDLSFLQLQLSFLRIPLALWVWLLGDGRLIRFLFGNSSLATVTVITYLPRQTLKSQLRLQGKTYSCNNISPYPMSSMVTCQSFRVCETISERVTTYSWRVRDALRTFLVHLKFFYLCNFFLIYHSYHVQFYFFIVGVVLVRIFCSLLLTVIL